MSSLSVKLAEGFTPVIKKSEKVVKGQVIASKTKKGADHEINIYHILSVNPKKASNLFVKNPGDGVSEGDVVAFKKGTLGMGSKKAVSPVSGTVFRFDKDTGVLTIRTGGVSDEVSEEVFSPVDGEVLVCNNEEIQIRTQKGVILARLSLGIGESQGELEVIKGEETDPFSIKNVGGKILAGKFLSREAIAKSIGLGVLGLISQNIREEDLENLREKMNKTPIFILDDKDYAKIAREHGNKVYIDPKEKTIIIL